MPHAPFMNILFVVPYVPDLVRVRPYQFIRSLLRRGHGITLATLPVGDSQLNELEHLRELGVRLLTQAMPTWRSLVNSLCAVPTKTPLQAVYSVHPALLRQIDQALLSTPFDAVHVEHLRGSGYALHIKGRIAAGKIHTASRHIPVVWDSVDSISHLFEQASQTSRSLQGKLMTRLELERTRWYEGMLVNHFERTLVTSPIDKSALEDLAVQHRSKSQLNQPMPVEVIPNGVDLEKFGYRNHHNRKSARIVFSGKMSYHANVTAAVHLVKDIMPAVWAQRPDAEVWIIGKDPAPEVRALATATPLSTEAKERRVIVTGTVTDVNSYLQEATIAVAPLLYGAGIQNKVLEAMACGTPVVASRKATMALLAQDERDLFVADDAQEFAHSILLLLNQPSRRAEMGHLGRRFVEAHHTWEGAVTHLEEIYSRATAIESIV